MIFIALFGLILLSQNSAFCLIARIPKIHSIPSFPGVTTRLQENTATAQISPQLITSTNHKMFMKGFSTTSPPTLGPVFDAARPLLRLCDIGTNVKDEMFSGKYHGARRLHGRDIDQVLERARPLGVCSMIFTGHDVKNSASTLNFCTTGTQAENTDLFCTAGIHPCSSKIFDEKGVEPTIEQLVRVIEDGIASKKLVALGEMGLDYDRLQRCPAATQRIGFERQLELATNYDLPLFLHTRNAEADFLALMSKYHTRLRGGAVVHCFTGSAKEMQALIDLGFYIGFTGASLRTEQGLANAALVPDHLLLLETDAPLCGIKTNHPSYKYVHTTFPMRTKEKYEEGVLVKERNEPCTMVQVLEVVAKVRNQDPYELAAIVYENTERLFPLIKRG